MFDDVGRDHDTEGVVGKGQRFCVGQGEVGLKAFVRKQTPREDELAERGVDSDAVNAGSCGGQQILPRPAA